MNQDALSDVMGLMSRSIQELVSNRGRHRVFTFMSNVRQAQGQDAGRRFWDFGTHGEVFSHLKQVENVVSCDKCGVRSEFNRYDGKISVWQIPQEGLPQTRDGNFEYIDEKMILTCPICKDFIAPENAMTSTGGTQTWCYGCLITALKYSDKCPHCKKKVKKTMLGHDKYYRRFYEEIFNNHSRVSSNKTVKCDVHSEDLTGYCKDGKCNLCILGVHKHEESHEFTTVNNEKKTLNELYSKFENDQTEIEIEKATNFPNKQWILSETMIFYRVCKAKLIKSGKKNQRSLKKRL